MEWAIGVLAFIIARDTADADLKPPDYAGFQFYGIEVNVPRTWLQAIQPLMPEDPRTQEEFEERLGELRHEFFGDNEPTLELVDGLEDKARRAFYTVIAIALLRGHVRWPRPEERGLTV